MSFPPCSVLGIFSNHIIRHGQAKDKVLTGPQLAAVVQVADDLHAVSLSSLAGLAADLDDILAQSRGDALSLIHIYRWCCTQCTQR